MLTIADILDDLRKLGIKEGDRVLVHTSLSKVGMLEGGPAAFVEAIVSAVGNEGLAVFPTFTGTAQDSAENPPYFDVRETPCWTGKVPEAARRREDAIRSLHPTHSVVAIGADTKQLVKDHEKVETPCSHCSPFMKLAENSGKILLVGVDHNSNTTFHTAEELADCPYHMLPEPALATVVDYQGKEHKILTALHKWGTERDFNRLEEEFIKQGIQRNGKIGNALCRLIDTKPMLEVAVAILKKDPYFLVVN